MEVDSLDFDPLEGGSADINDTITDDDMQELLPQQKETRQTWWERTKERFSRRGISKERGYKLFKNSDESNEDWEGRVREDIEMVDLGKHHEEKVEEAWDIIKSKYPNINPKNAPFTTTIDEYNRVIVRFNRRGGKGHVLFNEEGELNDKVPKTIVNYLGDSAGKVIENNERTIFTRREKLQALEEELDNISLADSQDVREGLNISLREQIEKTINEIEQLEEQNEVIEERMSLRDRIKAVFKKYGFTVFSVVSAVGIIIGVIISSLKSGLSSVVSGVGNGLKAIGKKLAQILPGMVGAIASFIFRTAGEVIGFLAKNAWLLIVAVVLYFVERYKKKR